MASFPSFSALFCSAFYRISSSKDSFLRKIYLSITRFQPPLISKGCKKAVFFLFEASRLAENTFSLIHFLLQTASIAPIVPKPREKILSHFSLKSKRLERIARNSCLFNSFHTQKKNSDLVCQTDFSFLYIRQP